MIAVVDYGMGNLRSVEKALRHVGGEARIVTTPSEIARAEKVVLPGVGICLGFQLLFDVSYEDGQYTGLGVFPGKIVRFDFPPAVTGQVLKIPHMGWNQIQCDAECPLLYGIENGAYVYFVHSYHAVPINDGAVAAVTEYGYVFPSAVWSGRVFATQFHPEKSQTVGLRILRNFVEL